MHNLDIREAIKKANLKHYEVADLLGISENTFVRKQRKELSKEKKSEIFYIINNHKKEVN